MDCCWCSVRLPLRLDMFPSIRFFSKVNPKRSFRSWLGILPTSCDQQVPCLGRAIWMWLMVREPKTSRLHFLEIWKKMLGRNPGRFSGAVEKNQPEYLLCLDDVFYSDSSCARRSCKLFSCKSWSWKGVFSCTGKKNVVKTPDLGSNWNKIARNPQERNTTFHMFQFPPSTTRAHPIRDKQLGLQLHPPKILEQKIPRQGITQFCWNHTIGITQCWMPAWEVEQNLVSFPKVVQCMVKAFAFLLVLCQHTTSPMWREMNLGMQKCGNVT